jgi:hypothetical protein
MLEYIPRDRFVAALSGLRALLKTRGRFVLFMTKRNWLTRPLIGHWWDSHLYTADELAEALRLAHFRSIVFRSFPLTYRYLATWGHVVEAEA